MARIDPDRWRLLSPYLDEALDTPPGTRSAWLAGIRQRDPGIAADLESMLREHDQVSGEDFLSGAVLDPALQAPPSMEGTVLGAYRLVSLIGQGGSGSVWLAERCDGRFHGQAAVKLLRVDLVANAGEDRFRREGTILARLRHPAIAHLIDSGVAPTGEPYLVLEHVDGVPIDRYCEEQRLSIEARLRLFLRVLEAVAHAHGNLVVHRDIKPANVMISTDGAVKLLDFGIAKLVEPQDGWRDCRTHESSAFSREIGRALTPAYAAPEQLSGGDVTTATDVYALGVLLYVLLTGQHPAGAAATSHPDLVRSILLTEPAPPSRVVLDRGEGPGVQAGVSAGRLHRRLQGDLDAIVARALVKDPASRYPSVTAFADDIRRHLALEPISARPPTPGYRAGRFVRRHTAAVLSGAAVLLLIAGITAVHTSRLSAERDRAHREASKATKVSELLVGLLTSADPFAIPSLGAEPTVRQLLDRGSGRVREDLASEPGLQLEMLTMMGRTYRRLGVYDRAQSLLEEAIAIGAAVEDTEGPRIAQAHDLLGVVLAERGDHEAGRRQLERALDLRRQALGARHPDVAITLAELGRVLQDQGHNDRAQPLHAEALEIRRTALGPGHMEVAVSLSDLASVMRLNGQLDEAEGLLQESLAINRRERGEAHPNTATSMHDLALIALTRGEYVSAERQLRAVLEMQRRALGPKHPIVAVTLNSLSHAFAASGRLDAAAESLDEALAIVRPALGSEHQLVALYTINRGALDLRRGRPGDAERLISEGLRVRAQAPGVVPSRRRTLAADQWTMEGATRLLERARQGRGGAIEAGTAWARQGG
jgi:serine/threonine protein kinase/tetratricopeptide (TPR) repeat protein